jgi:hypothetical protein
MRVREQLVLRVPEGVLIAIVDMWYAEYIYVYLYLYLCVPCSSVLLFFFLAHRVMVDHSLCTITRCVLTRKNRLSTCLGRSVERRRFPHVAFSSFFSLLFFGWRGGGGGGVFLCFFFLFESPSRW